ncbi:hypothetical protein MMC30_002813 [Trapelia coarctata]|nr:hypothetical protein [Trapelia coarctata]
MPVASKPSPLTVTPRGALRNISNNATPTGIFEPPPSYENGVLGGLKDPASIRTPSTKLATGNDPFSNERKISTSHGDLSSIRPKSPPLPAMTPGSKEGRQLFPPFSSPESPWIPIHPKEPAKTPRYEAGSQLTSARLRSPLRSFAVAPDAKAPGHIALIGLKATYKSPIDVYTPIVQTQKPLAKARQGLMLDSLRLMPSIEQLDVSTVWTNLSIGIAEILFEMNRVIGPCLESMLATRLEELDVAARREYSPFKGNLSGELNNTSPLVFSLGDLIDSILGEMQFHCYHHMSLQSPEVLLELMMLYLVSLNNIDEVDGPATADAVIHIGLRPGEDIASDIVPPPTAHVVQHLDYLSFSGLDAMPREGTTIKIVPQYSRGVFNKTNDSYSEVSYAMESKPSWLEWDDEISGWQGKLPLYSEWRGKSKNLEEVISGGRVGPYAVVNLLRLEVKAVLIERHSSASVRLKRTVRARLTLKVIPWYAHENSHASHGHPQPKKAKIGNCNESWHSPTPQLRSKADLSPGLPRKYVDEHFGLGCDRAVFDTISQQDLQVYRLSDAILDWRPSTLHGTHLGIVHNEHQPRVRRFVPRSSEETRTWSREGIALIPRDLDLYTSGNNFAAEPIISRQASSRISHSSDRSHRMPSSRNRYTWSPNDSGLETRNSDYLRAANTMRRQVSDHLSDAGEKPRNRSQSYDRPIQLADDELHWQDSEEFGSEFFDEHDRHERRHSLHNASPELFGLAELLHERCSQTEEDSAIQSAENECLSPSQPSGLRAGHKEEEGEDASSPCLKDERRQTSLSNKNMHAPPHVTFFHNKFSALWGLDGQDRHQSQTPARLPNPDSDCIETGRHSKEDSGYLSDAAIAPSHPERGIVSALENQESQQTKLFDSMAGDPQIRREQELLWDLLTSKGMDGDKGGTKDRKLEAEEKKGLWEVLRWEARQKQRNEMSEETLGMETPDEREDISSRGEPDGNSFHYEGDDNDIQGSWNFGC